MLTFNDFKNIYPRSLTKLGEEKCNQLYLGLTAGMFFAEVLNPQAQLIYMAQFAHESTDYTKLEENFNYRATRLLEVFPKYFKSQDEAEHYSKLGPAAIASRVYANRYGNKDEKSGDGWRYRGRGIAQTTFLDNYIAVGYQADPDKLCEPYFGAYSAAIYWKNKNLNKVCEEPIDTALIKSTILINGGKNGLEERKKQYAKLALYFKS